MTKLLKKEIEFEWTKERERSFNNIKELVRKILILMLYNLDKSNMIQLDAIGYALGIILE